MGEIKLQSSAGCEFGGSLIEWGVAAAPFPGESSIGDSYLVKPFKNGVLIAVSDGLGHGREAAEASEAAMAVLGAHAEESVISLIRRCHQALTRTRGVALTLASFNSCDQTMTWIGVGNVESVLLRPDYTYPLDKEDLLLRPGVVGYQLPPLRASILSVSSGDLLVIATDGVRADFVKGLFLKDPPQKSAETILSHCKKGNDDALVFAARCFGNA